MTWLQLHLMTELGMTIAGGRLRMMVAAIFGLILLGMIFSFLPLRRVLPLLRWRLLSQKSLQERQ